MKQILELRKLTKKFYKDYPKRKFPEIEHKSSRPYVVLLVKVDDVQFAIPLRSNIRHSYCYKFKTSDRETNSSTAIDFSKAVVITNPSYLGNNTDINDKEYLEIQQKTFFILKQFKRYVNGYIKFKLEGGNKHTQKKYRFTTLEYFNDVILKNIVRQNR